MYYIKLIIVILSMLLSLSIGEWVIHKYIMHNTEGSFGRFIFGDNHIVHHNQVNSDMTLKEGEEHVGLYFGVFETLAVSVLFMVVQRIIMYIIKFDCKITYSFGISLAVGLFYKFLWDFLHYSFHDLTDDLEINKLNPYFYWWFKNHAYHHLVKGEAKGNYNIIVPGADFLFGTYRSCVTNKEYCKKNPNEICDMEKKVKLLKHGFSFCEN